MKKKLVLFLVCIMFGLCLFSCDKELTPDTIPVVPTPIEPTTPDDTQNNPTAPNTPVEPTIPDTPVEPTALSVPTGIKLTDNVLSWDSVEHADGYVVNKNGSNLPKQSGTTYTVTDTAVGDYVLKVKAVSSDTKNYKDSAYTVTVTYTIEDVGPVELKASTLFVVGDSTLASFKDSYYYPRYGYGTQLENYFDKKLTVNNLALSGRSSKSFLTEENYQKLLTEMKQNDYLLIGFGHNDEKSDDAQRFTDASKPLSDSSSFQYRLYENYVKVALDKGATPILCTPVVRADSNNNYDAASGHVTENGDYAQAIVDLGAAKNVTVINLRDLTKAKYKALGYNEAIYYHAMTAGMLDTDGTTIIPNVKSVDKTHLNIYGAKYVAYLIASELAKTSNTLGDYVLDGITEPTKDKDLVANADYKVSPYSEPALDSYTAPTHFTTITQGWYGTGFGDTGGTPNSATSGYIAKETVEGVFQVGQHLDSGSTKGKFSSAGEGFAFVFKQVEKSKNFEISAEMKVITTFGTKQVGFGLMLRDDCFINQTINTAVSSNYLTAGFLMNDGGTTNILFKRENSTLDKGKNVVNSFVALNDTATLKLVRIGQSITTTVIYKGTTYTETTYDFDLFAVDSDYMYVGFFGNRGTIIEVSNIVFTDKGESLGA